MPIVGYLEQRAGLEGRLAVIMGGGGGLGRACAVDLAMAGVRVALCDRDAAGLNDTAATLRQGGADVMTMALDARDAEAVTEFFAAVDTRFGERLNVLINVVGGTFRQPFTESAPRGWDAIIRTNFTWLLHATQLAIPRMRAAGAGSIISLTSIEGHRAAPGFAVYAAMKAAVTNFTCTLAVELAPVGIRVNTIAPDFVPTPSLMGLAPLSDEAKEVSDFAHRIGIPMGRDGTYEDVGGCALFLASDLSSFVTGTTLHPDGGATASAGWFNWPDVGFTNQPPAGVVEYLMGNSLTPGDS